MCFPGPDFFSGTHPVEIAHTYRVRESSSEIDQLSRKAFLITEHTRENTRENTTLF